MVERRTALMGGAEAVLGVRGREGATGWPEKKL